MIKKWMIFCLIVLGFQASFATSLMNTVSLEASEEVLGDTGINIAKSASVSMTSDKLPLVGAGLRTKFMFNVYVVQIFNNAPQTVKRNATEVLDSVAAATHSVVHLSFLRNVKNDQIRTSFQEALIKNKVDVNSASIQSFFQAVQQGGAAQDGSELALILSHLPNGMDQITYVSPEGKLFFVEGPGLVKAILSIWLGTPADSGLQSCKNELLLPRSF